MTRPAGRSGTSGMTLVEVLVALAVFAIIGIAAFTMLDQTLRSERLAGARLARLADVQRLMRVVSVDTLQAIAGSLTRDDAGISFLRRGSVATDGAQVVESLAVRYHLDASGLIREIGAPGADPAWQVLLTGLRGASWRLLQDGGELPASAATTGAEGIELVVRLGDDRVLRGVFPLPHDPNLSVPP